MIIRGIGYRAFYVINDYGGQGADANLYTNAELGNLANVVAAECIYRRFLVIRAGHTTDLYYGIPPGLFVRVLKKDRKLVIFGQSAAGVSYFSKVVSLYRLPSAYTGRGIRYKHIKPIRKAGKKDKQKGKSF